MTYVFQLVQTGVPDENRRGCTPALILLAFIAIFLTGTFLFSTGLIITIFYLVLYYLIPIAVAVILGVLAIVMSSRQKRGYENIRYLVIDEHGIQDRFRGWSTQTKWNDVVAVELRQNLLIIRKQNGFPARFAVATSSVDADAFATFCREKISAGGRQVDDDS